MTLTTFPATSSIGFDRLLRFFAEDVDALAKPSSYPPHNILKISDHDYVVEMAVAGYSEEDLEINFEKNKLTIKGEIKREQEGEYLHKGLSSRAFTKVFTLIDTLIVKNASLTNGILRIELFNDIPEQQKPRKIQIAYNSPKLLVE